MGTLIKWMSDLHIDVNRTNFVDILDERSKDTILILAGDVCEVDDTKKYSDFLHTICPNYRQVLLIMGNHEYYNGSVTRAIKKLENEVTDIPNIIFMDRKAVIIDDIKFIGATLWTDMNKDDPLFMLRVKDQYTGLNDYYKIRIGSVEEPYKYRLRPIDTLALHRKDLKFIQDELTYDTRKTVVITHHAPCISLMRDGPYANHPLNPAYASQLEEFVAISYIDLWIHGHIHWGYEVEFFGTKISCNPRGYHDSENPQFNANNTIEL